MTTLKRTGPYAHDQPTSLRLQSLRERVAALLTAVTALAVLVSGPQGVYLLLGAADIEAAGVRCSGHAAP